MKKFSIFNFQFSIIVFGLFFLINSSNAVEPPKNNGDYVYHFFLYYDQGQLFGDRDYEIKYEVVPGKFTPEKISLEQESYRVEIENFKNKVVQNFKFDPKKGDPNFMSGKVVINGPYVADGLRASFFSPSNQHLLTIFVSDSSFCNDNGSCEESRGEDTNSCPLDCKKVRNVTVVDMKSNQNPPPNTTVITILYIIFALGISSAIWFGWRWWRPGKLVMSTEPEPPNFFNNNSDEQTK